MIGACIHSVSFGHKKRTIKEEAASLRLAFTKFFPVFDFDFSWYQSVGLLQILKTKQSWLAEERSL